MAMTPLFVLLVILAALIDTFAAYISRVYSEFGKILSREVQDNLDEWEEKVEPLIGLTPRTCGALCGGAAAAHIGVSLRWPSARCSSIAPRTRRDLRILRLRRRAGGGAGCGVLQPASAVAAVHAHQEDAGLRGWCGPSVFCFG